MQETPLPGDMLLPLAATECYEKVLKVSNRHVENHVENPAKFSLISLLALLSAKCTKVQHHG